MRKTLINHLLRTASNNLRGTFSKYLSNKYFKSFVTTISIMIAIKLFSLSSVNVTQNINNNMFKKVDQKKELTDSILLYNKKLSKDIKKIQKEKK
jgi:hypothetical protein